MVPIIIVAAVLLLFVIVTYNTLVGLRNKVNEAFATMDVYLKKRYDLIPNLVDIVKGYAKHESDTLEELTRLRSGSSVKGVAEQVEGEMKIGAALSRISIIAENYPDLKANENFLDLQNKLMKVEEDIAFSRRYYNGSVRELNNRCQMFPYNIIAGLFQFKTMPMYEVQSESERKVVDVNV